MKTIELSELKEEPSTINVVNNYQEVIDKLDVSLSVVLGKHQLTLAQLQRLKVNQVLVLDTLTTDPVDIVLNNNVIARGELVVVEDKFAVEITEIGEQNA